MNNRDSFDWTDKRIALLKTMWLDGASGGVIAARLGGGLSRSAVIGKANRLGFKRSAEPARPRCVAPPKPALPRPAAVKPQRLPAAPRPPALTLAGDGAVMPKAPPVAMPILRVVEAADPKPLVALGRRDCRHPENDGQDPVHGWLYCGEAVEGDGGQYCARCRPVMVDRGRTARSNRDLRRMRA